MFDRSPAVVIAYLMKAKGWRLAQSHRWVKDRRPSVELNPGTNTVALLFLFFLFFSFEIFAVLVNNISNFVQSVVEFSLRNYVTLPRKW